MGENFSVLGVFFESPPFGICLLNRELFFLVEFVGIEV